MNLAAHLISYKLNNYNKIIINYSIFTFNNDFQERLITLGKSQKQRTLEKPGAALPEVG